MSWTQAREIAYDAAAPLPPLQVAVADAVGLVLAEDLVARCALPPFDVSAMDGWAVHGSGPWDVVGEVMAGDRFARPLAEGEAVGIATGAAVPVGTSAVVRLERGSVTGTRLDGQLSTASHVRRAGEELAAGTRLLPGGALLTPAGVGLAAAVGHDALLVHRRPRVAAVVTGSELVVSGLPGEGRIRDAVGPLLPGAVAALGGELVSTSVLPDDRGRLRSALLGSADVVLTSGSSSAGPADHLASVLLELDADVLVNGVDVRPGHPQLLARLPSGTWVVGLPGNPLAALVALVTLAGPLLARLAGRLLPLLGSAVLDAEPGQSGTTRLVPVRVIDGRAVPTGHDGSAMLRGVALADAFAVVTAEVRPGDHVDLVPLPT